MNQPERKNSTSCSASRPASRPVRVDHRDTAQAVPAHRHDRIEEMVVGRNGDDRRSHHVLDRLIGCRAPSDASHHVLLGENAGRPAVRIRRRSLRCCRPAPCCSRPRRCSRSARLPRASAPYDRGQRSETVSSASATDRPSLQVANGCRRSGLVRKSYIAWKRARSGPTVGCRSCRWSPRLRVDLRARLRRAHRKPYPVQLVVDVGLRQASGRRTWRSDT